MEVIMSKIYYFIVLLLAMPVLNGMENHDNYEATQWIEETPELNFIRLEQELLKITDEKEQTPTLFSLDQDSFANMRAEMLDMIDEDSEQDSILQRAIENARKYCPIKSKKSHNVRSANEIAIEILSENYTEPKINFPIDPKNENVDRVIELYTQILQHGEKLHKILEAVQSMDEVTSVKKVLDEYLKRYPHSPEWNSDLHELTLNRLTQKFGFNETFKQMALQFNTAGALTWLSKQKIACQTIPAEKLNDLVIDARVAFHNCDTPKTLALISLLNKTSFKDSAREALCKALVGAVSTINELKNPKVMEPKVIARIHILGHAGYNLEKSCGPILMQQALKSGFPRIVSLLQQHGVTNPTKPALPFYQPRTTQVNEDVIHLEKMYAKKDTGESLEDYIWKPCPSTKRKVAKDDPTDDTLADQ